ncbi:MAG TPA: Dyp-type peroxidase [Polyangiaceae bacterium]|nr:Dyp-type peroxidase [Polyangiaceae bacterium]
MSKASQPGILAALPAVARQLTLRLAPNANVKRARAALQQLRIDANLVVGLGAPLTLALKLPAPGLRVFPALAGARIAVPSTQQALWCWLRGSDRGALVHEGRRLLEQLGDAFQVDEILDTFQYADSRDLSGYVDGTENPKGSKAASAALAADGSSFVAVQKWVHDLNFYLSLPDGQRDHIMGRRLSDNEEIADAPESAHVKRTAQETFSPPAFILRRSMPWSIGEQAGLQFLAFGKSLDTYETLLRHMLGLDDGIVDGLFRFSKPVTGGYYWCPPCRAGRLILNR